MTDSTVLGVDIGGSHITAAFVDLESRTLLERTTQRAKIKSDDTCQNIISAWSALIQETAQAQQKEITKIGIALPGPFDYENGISYIRGLQKYESLYGKNVKTLLARELNIPEKNIRLKNDAGCFLQGELFAGNTPEINRCIGITLGTGIGTATAINGFADDSGLWKAPLKDSIAEDYLSTRWFVKRYEQYAGRQVRDVKQLCELYSIDASVQVVFSEFADNLTEFLIYFIRKENAELVIVGGNITHASAFFLPQVISSLAKESIHTPIKISTLGEEAVILGSASLWHKKLLLAK